MLLERLREYASERMEDQPPPLYSSTPVAYVVTIDADGIPLSPRPTERIDPDTRRGERGMEMIAPEIQRAGPGAQPLLLADNSEYTFGRANTDRLSDAEASKRQARAAKRHGAYMALLGSCAESTGEPAVLAVQRFYEQGGVLTLDLGEEWQDGLKVAFDVRISGETVNPIDLPSVQRFWSQTHQPEGTVRQCLTCGNHKPLLQRLQGKIKRIPGGQPSGTSVISANEDAFESYGLEASETAPTCAECGEDFTRALNHLLLQEDSHLSIGGVAFAFWTRKPMRESFDLARLTRDPDPDQVRHLLDSVRRGNRQPGWDSDAFYAVSLSASGGRAVVRDWVDTTIGDAKRQIARWFEWQRLSDPRDEDPSGQNPDPLSLFRLAISTVRESKDIPPSTPQSLFRTALAGSPLPMDMAQKAVMRNRAERGVRRERVALIKLVLLSRGLLPRKEGYMVALEVEHPEVAYHCGRLLSVIGRIQYAALGSVGASVVDRYYGSASSTPAAVFGTLIRGAQPHLSKLQGGRRRGLQNSLAEVCDRIKEFPRTLSLEQQAMFALGFYHQQAFDIRQAKERKAALAASANQ